MHLFSAEHRFYGGNAIVGGGIPVAGGLALADQTLGLDRVTVCFFGEGAMAEGEFHETMNLAALWDLPVLFCCENNLYAMGTALDRSEAVTDMALKASAYGMPSWSIDGMDVEAVRDGAGRAVDRKFFTVTSAGLVVKRSRESIFAYVTSLVTNDPVANASITVFDNTPVKREERERREATKPPERLEDLPVRIVHRGKTDASGVYHHKLKSDQHLSVLAVAPDNSYAFASTGSPYSFAREETKFFIYTDRPVYRAGDTVHYKIIAKKREKRFSMLASTPVAKRPPPLSVAALPLTVVLVRVIAPPYSSNAPPA